MFLQHLSMHLCDTLHINTSYSCHEHRLIRSHLLVCTAFADNSLNALLLFLISHTHSQIVLFSDYRKCFLLSKSLCSDASAEFCEIEFQITYLYAAVCQAVPRPCDCVTGHGGIAVFMSHVYLAMLSVFGLYALGMLKD